MLRYIIKRILFLIPIIICVSFIVFALMELTPGSIIDAMVSPSMTAEDIAVLREKFDLDRSMLYRYGKYMYNLVQGDLGISYFGGINVWETYISRLPNTLLLSLASLIIGVVISIPMGIRAARRAGKASDTVTTATALVGMSMPSFWLGLLLLFLFSYNLRWLPSGGNTAGIKSYILPAICSGFMLMAISTRQTRSSMLEVLNADYLRTARAKGVPERMVIRKHALGNALIPIITTIGGSLSMSLAGSAVVETVFTWPGVGRMIVEAVMARDVTMTCGSVIMTTILYVVIQLIVDLLYAFVDPRIKAQYSKTVKKRWRDSSVTKARIEPVILRPETVATETVESGKQDDRKESIDNEPAIVVTAENEALPHEENIEKTEAFLQTAGKVTSVEIADNTENEKLVAVMQSAVSIESAEIGDLASAKYKRRSHFNEIFHGIRKNKSAMAGLVIVCFLLLVLLGSLFINYQSVVEQSIPNRLARSDSQHLFGTDELGRDVFLRTLYGTRYSIAIGFGSTAIALIIGVMLGAIAGYFGGFVENLIMRFVDVVASIPGMLLGMVIVTVLGTSLRNLIIAVGVTAVPVFIRITRASVLTVRNNEFVEAARAIGLPNIRIIFRQVLPNGLSPIIVTFTASLGTAIIVGAGLSFLGFGIPVPQPEWGAIISGGRMFLRAAPHIMAAPGIAIMITVLAFNLLGDGLRDALDPKLKR